jgi:hypothetical protein
MTWFRQRLAPGYDLFKLLVAVILIILLALSFRSQQSALISQTADASTLASTATQIPAPLATKTQTFTQTPAAQLDTPTPTLTPQPPMPTAVPLIPTETFTALPPTGAPTPTPDSGCPALQSRIQIGDKVQVALRLNFRTGPGLEYPIIQTNGVGTNLEVIGGPICNVRTTSMGDKAYMWWNVRMSNGMEGWSAEAPLINSFYFLDPVK